MEKPILGDEALNQLFRYARSYNGWLDKPVSEVQLRGIIDLMKMAPTSANSQPVRIKFLMTPEAKERLKPHLIDSNVDKVMTSPVTAILGYDLEFHERLPQLFPHTDARSWFAGDDELIETTAFRNSTLQGGYFILAARAMGLDCGPMSGFDNEGVDKEFFAGTPVKSNFICGVGYGDPKSIFERSPRPSFEDLAEIL